MSATESTDDHEPDPPKDWREWLDAIAFVIALSSAVALLCFLDSLR